MNRRLIIAVKFTTNVIQRLKYGLEKEINE